MTISRLWMSTWVAARPIPGASYIVSAMSAPGANAVIDRFDARRLFQTRIGKAKYR
jgi:hypothetical protein